MQAILFDMDGVLYNSETPIEGAAEVMRWVRARGIPHLFVTNTSSRGRSQLAAKLQGFDIPAAPTDILTPAAAAAGWLRAHGSGNVALFVRPATRPEFDGLAVLPDTAENGARYVVIGDLGSGWDFDTLNRAFRLLHSDRESVPIALGMTRYWQASDGLRLDAGPFVAALEYATGRQAVVFGKPAATFFDAAVEKLGIPAAEVLMIGDDIETDVAGAQRAGLKGALVRTGKFRLADLQGGVTPDAVLDSISSLPEWWHQAQ